MVVHLLYIECTLTCPCSYKIAVYINDQSKQVDWGFVVGDIISNVLRFVNQVTFDGVDV